jgi:hypothetical protein
MQKYKMPLIFIALGLFLLVFDALVLHSLSIQKNTAHTIQKNVTDELKNERYKPFEADYFAAMLSYPTGNLNPMWLQSAAHENRQLKSGIPSGAQLVPLKGGLTVLDPTRFTSLGPAPQNSLGNGLVGGRVNVILVDPNDTSTAYFGSDGGGVWKTTNCCGEATTWTVKTDFPELSTTAIGDMVFDPNNSSTIYAGTGDLRYGSFSFGTAGLLKSTDRGETWQLLGADVFSMALPLPIGAFPQYQAIGKVVVDPRNSNNIIVGTKTGLFISNDGGGGWSGPCYTNAFGPGSMLPQRQDVTGLIAINRDSTTRLIVAVGTRGHETPVQYDLNQNGANGLYRAVLPASGCPAISDWSLISRGPDGSDPGNGWPAGTGSGIPRNGGSLINPLGRIDLAMAPSDNNTIYAQVASPVATSGDYRMLGVWATVDGGDHWAQRATFSSFTGCNDAGGQAWYNAGMLVHQTNPNILFLSSIDLWRSNDGARTFNNLTCSYSDGIVHPDQHARAFVGTDPNRLLIGNDGGIYFSQDAQAVEPTFDALNRGVNTIEFYSGDITANFNTTSTPSRGIAGGAQDNGSSVHQWSGSSVSAASWSQRLGGDGIYAHIEPLLGNRWYLSSQNGGIRASSTGPYGTYNINVQAQANNWGGDRRSFLMPFEIYKHSDVSACSSTTGCGRLIVGTYRVWETLSGGISAGSWYPTTAQDLTKGTLLIGSDNRSFINQLAYSFTDARIAVVGTNDGNFWMGFNLGSGIANQANWVNLTADNTTLPNRPVMDVITDGSDPLIAYAVIGGFNQNTPGTPGHVFRVTCSANCASFNWANKTGNLPNIPANAVMVNPNNSHQVFVGTDWGLYYTDDIDVAAPVWRRFTAGIPTAMVWDLAVDRGYTTLAVFTRSRGAYAWPLPAVSDQLFVNGFESP